MRVSPEMIIAPKNPNPPDPMMHAEYPREDRFQKAVERWFKQMGWRTYHTWNSMHSTGGFPDLVAAHEAARRTLFAELKTEKGVVSEEQIRWLTMLANAGHEVYLWRPSDMDEIMTVLQTTHDATWRG